MRVFERALRRACIPVAMSEGYNPHPRLSFPMALGVSMAGLSEVVDVALAEWMRPGELSARLQAELPEGIDVRSAEFISRHANRQPVELSYRVPLLPEHSVSDQKLADLLALDSLVISRQRKGRSYEVDIRPFVKALRLDNESLLILLRYTEHGTARPQEVLQALSCQEEVDYLASAIERTHVRLTPIA